VAISPYLAALRERIGHELVLLPSVAVLPRDDAGRVLLVLNAESGRWQTIGGAVEPDETPREAAAREALEEAGIVVDLGRIVGVVGGPQFKITYPNGDQAAYVATVFEARVGSGEPGADGRETGGVEWWAPAELAGIDLDELNEALLREVWDEAFGPVPPGGIEPPLRP
jgi:8-oxo-dGTP pyrophosphatase MutT (NUDIX family)